MILILDFGSQYTQLIARRIRGLNVYSEVLPFSTSNEIIREKSAKGIILSGGPSSVKDKNAPTLDKKVFDLGIPILGICYGMQLIADQFGGNVQPSSTREYGAATLEINDPSKLFHDIPKEINIWMSHSDSVGKIPSGFKGLGCTSSCKIAAFEHTEKSIYGIQFHPEVSHTDYGKDIIQNFIKNICKVENNWTSDAFIEHSINRIKEQVGNNNVLCALSGGVDSSVVAALLNKAIGDQLTCMFIDTGYMRINEGDKIKRVFEDEFNINLIYVNAQDILHQAKWDI